MKSPNWFPLLFASLTLLAGKAQAADYMLGADLSSTPQAEARGVKFSSNGKAEDLLPLLHDHGFNWVRIRIFEDPKAADGYSREGYCDLGHTLAMAHRIQAAGMKFLLDFHYSDTWADPAHQTKPAAWKEKHGPELEKAVHDYTASVLAALAKQGTPPDMVQTGNEINHGLLWPDGQPWKLGSWDSLCGLLNAAISAVREITPQAKVMLHVATGGRNQETCEFFDHLRAHHVAFNVIGLSYYPRWDGPLENLKRNLADLLTRYPQPIVVVEYSAPQLREINDAIHALPHGKGLGSFIWEPAHWGGPALFERDGKAKPTLELYPQMAQDYGIHFTVKSPRKREPAVTIRPWHKPCEIHEKGGSLLFLATWRLGGENLRLQPASRATRSCRAASCPLR